MNTQSNVSTAQPCIIDEVIEERNNGQDPYSNEQDDKRMQITPLMRAAQQNRVEEVRELLQRGANPNERSNTGMTALMYNAITARSPEIIELLIMANAYVDTQDNQGITALMYATANLTSFPKDSLADPVINALVEKGKASIAIQDIYGDTALGYLPNTTDNLHIEQRRNYLVQASLSMRMDPRSY